MGTVGDGFVVCNVYLICPLFERVFFLGLFVEGEGKGGGMVSYFWL